MKFWAIALALAVAAALLPSCQEKSETTRRIVVTAVGIDAGEDGRCRLSIQAIESLKTSGSLTEQEIQMGLTVLELILDAQESG